MPLKILVTGGAGFIGSHITDCFLECGHEVVVIDNLSSGEIGNVNPEARFYQIDILDLPKLKMLGERERFDIICHQAALVNVRESFELPAEYTRVNVVGSINLLEMARDWHVKKFIYASSGGAVYGEPKYLPVDESHFAQPLDFYGTSKHLAENYLALYNVHFGIPYTVLRYANVYGPRQNPHGENGVVSIFAHAMLKGDPSVIINGTGEQMRDFIYVDDVARANLLALDRGANQVFNVASGKGMSISDICLVLCQKTGYEGKVIHDAPKQGEVFKIWLSNAQAKTGLGWIPQIDLNEGLDRTLRFLQNHYPRRTRT